MRKVHHPKIVQRSDRRWMVVCEDCRRDSESAPPIGINTPWNLEKWCSSCGRTIASAVASRAAPRPENRRLRSVVLRSAIVGGDPGKPAPGRVPERPLPRSTAVCEATAALGRVGR